EHAAVVSGHDARIEYARVSQVIANTADRAERLALDDARAALVGRELAPMRRERLARERDVVESLGLGGYTDAFVRLSGIDLRALATGCDALLRDPAAVWDDVLPTFARRRLGVPVAELTRAGERA